MADLSRTRPQRAADDKPYTLATFSLGGDGGKIKYVVPQEADFAFIRDANRADDSTFAVLMRTTSPAKGQPIFMVTMLPPGAQAVTMLSNRVFMRDALRPALIDGLTPKLAGNPGNGYQQVEQRILLADDADGTCHIRNNSEIGLNVDSTARIDYLHCYVAGGDQLRLEFKFATSVTWPYMEQLEIKKVSLPSAVTITGDLKLLA